MDGLPPFAQKMLFRKDTSRAKHIGSCRLWVSFLLIIASFANSAAAQGVGAETTTWNHEAGRFVSAPAPASAQVPATPQTPAEPRRSTPQPRLELAPLEESADPPARPLPQLTPRGETSELQTTSGRGTQSWTVVMALLFVVLLAAGATRYWAKFGSQRATIGSSGPVEVLHRTRLNSRSHVMLIRVGNRVLAVGATADGLSTLSEITEPDEVAELIEGVQGNRNSPAKAFQTLLKPKLNETQREAARPSFSQFAEEHQPRSAQAGIDRPTESVSEPVIDPGQRLAERLRRRDEASAATSHQSGRATRRSEGGERVA
ncbi:FliO/MopB family protein [Stratiformator vulcanicus]|uniref:Flagellar biosynthesis protein, FliO n=1 Tax=Stratiformator vulcanicus TaxID=2527980 RepID=A0A517R575_9PLAN|nr:flagellar biosynthetic protein FliO [Stratiformator vulcanicus]QDT39047.1 Flagellar biosynthesis protein, FliO [Stratiformator vulcanicus]